MYKDKHNTTTNNSEFSEPVYAEVDDVLESPTIKSSQLEGSTKLSNIQPSDTPNHHTPTPVLRRYYRSHVLNRICMDYLLMTDGDAAFPGEVDHRRSTTSYIFIVGTTTVSWMSRIQKIIDLSTTEAEYVAVTEASKELIWLHGLLTELGFTQEKNVLYNDSQSAIHLAKNSAFNSRIKHIGLRYYFIRFLLEDEILTLRKILGSKNPTDMLTKVVTIDKLKYCLTSVGLLE
ncbi:hypothetical protein KIW84_072334 [Lathyrus oleraceus]|uniref:Retrovirus-related Pol polyprotein from transposon TNT 1-94 n=1 Tax=Pisum sativum TaxID=3888 RepID=A0A9D4ZX99_PEA|nr:hypothetical protein KIW84_072334 [Pisum sativum]